MQAVIVASLLWAAQEQAPPWASLGALVTIATLAVGSAVGVAGYRTNRAASRRQAELDGVKLGMESMVASLARADLDRQVLSDRLASTQSKLTETESALGKAQDAIELLRLDLADERRRNADRIKVLVRQLRRNGQVPEGEPEGE